MVASVICRVAPCRQVGAFGQGQQHKPEFACLCQADTAAQCHAPVALQRARQQGHQQRLEQYQCREHQQDPAQIDKHAAQIELHAYGDEEQAQQHVAERFDVLFDLIAVFGFGDQHACHKGAKRQREPGQFGEISQTQGDEQHVEREQFGRFLAGYDVEPAAHDVLTEYQQDQQHDHGLDHRVTQRGRQVVGL